MEHVLQCIGRIAEDAAAGRDAVFHSYTLQDAIIRNLQVLCESVRRIDAVYRDAHSEIDWKAITGMRNVLVHDYFDVDSKLCGTSLPAISLHRKRYALDPCPNGT